MLRRAVPDKCDCILSEVSRSSCNIYDGTLEPQVLTMLIGKTIYVQRDERPVTQSCGPNTGPGRRIARILTLFVAGSVQPHTCQYVG